MLVMGGEKDAFFSAGMVESTARIYGVTPGMFPEMAHAMMLEPDWQEAADRIIDWLGKIGL